MNEVLISRGNRPADGRRGGVTGGGTAGWGGRVTGMPPDTARASFGPGCPPGKLCSRGAGQSLTGKNSEPLVGSQ